MSFNGWGLEQRDIPAGSEELSAMLGPIYSHVIQCFGPNKCMFESNFPVDKVCLSYRVMWNSYKRLTESMGLSEDDMTLDAGLTPGLDADADGAPLTTMC